MTEVLAALISLGGAAIGTFGGILASARLTNYRLEQLEKKVDAHNHFAARMPVIEEQIHSIGQRVGRLENERGGCL